MTAERDSRTGHGAAPEPSEPSEPPEPSEPSEPSGVFSALAERGAAELSRAALVAETALVESRLAASSLLLLLLAVLCAGVLLTVSWVLSMALVAVGLAALGLGPAGGLGVVLGAHLVALLALGLFARSLAKNLRFGHTLRALGRDPEALAEKARRAAEAAPQEIADGAAHAASDALHAPAPPRGHDHDHDRGSGSGHAASPSVDGRTG